MTEHWVLEGTTEPIDPRPEVGDVGSIRVGRVETWAQVKLVLTTPDGLYMALNVLMPEHPPGRPVGPGMDGPACIVCGGMTKRTGMCFTCIDCASTTGCG